MESRGEYVVASNPLSQVKDMPCTWPYADDRYQPPTPDQVTALIKGMGWSQNDVAKLVGVSYDPKKGSTAVRKWRTPVDSSEHRAIPYAVWRLMLIEAGLAQK